MGSCVFYGEDEAEDEGDDEGDNSSA